jgi:hypothetical protein
MSAISMKKFYAIIVLFISTFCYGAKPPSEILDQLGILSNIEATIGMCLNSEEYKKLNADQALKFHDVSINIGIVVMGIEKKYDDNMAYIAVFSAAQDILATAKFKNIFSKSYSRKCAPQILVDTNEALNVTSNKIKSIMRRK